MKLPNDFEFITKPYDFQLEAFIFGITHPNVGLLLDMGLGKTKVSLDIARYRIKFNEVKKVWIVAPATIIYNWKSQIKLHSNYDSLVLATPKNERLYRILSSDYHFNIINYEALFPLLQNLGILEKIKTKKGRKILYGSTPISELKDILPDLIIFDESARYVSTPDTERTLASITLADIAKFKIILTGTPIKNKAMGIWSQFRILDGGKTFSNNFYKFRNYFFTKDTKDPFGRFIIIKNRIPLLTKGVYESCIRFKKEDVLKDLPQKISHTVFIKMPPELETIYQAIKKQILIEIETSTINTTLKINNALVRSLRLQQITAGFTVDQVTKKPIMLNYTPKLDALIEEIETILDAEEAAIIWTRFLYSIDLISTRLKEKNIKHVTMSGLDKNKEQRFEKWKSYQTNKNIPVFIGQEESGGIGIELFKIEGEPDKSQHTLFYENSYLLDVRLQAAERVHRIGQNSICRYVDFVVQNTIDERVLAILKENKNVADAIVDGGIQKLLN